MPETQFESFSIVIDAPIDLVYERWSRFAELPAILSTVESAVEDGDQVSFTMNIGGRRFSYRAVIVERIPCDRIAWRSVSGRDVGGLVRFVRQGPRTQLCLDLRYEPDGALEIIGDALGMVSDRVRADLQRFKEHVEQQVAGGPPGQDIGPV